MEETILNAMERSTEARRFRESGYIPGVLYGDNISKTIPVKFETSEVRKILAKHGSNAKVWVKHGDNKSFGFIKEVQRNAITRQFCHIDVHLVSQNHEVKMQIPIIFKGRESLKQKILLLQVYKSELEVFGKASLMPDVAVVDVSEKELGDTININDFNLDKQIKITDSKDEVYGIISQQSGQSVEEPTEGESIVTSPESQH
ncbi:MAG: 50S ribosomal protein L25 [Carboxydocellales bacterium]